MFKLIVAVIFVSQNCLKINGATFFNHPTPEPYQKHLFRVFEKYLEPDQVNFCVDCDKLIHLIPRTVSLVTISQNDKTINWPAYHKVDTYILNLTRETKERLEFMEKTPGWNPRAKFFIIYSKNTINYLLKILFSHYIVNVVIFSSPDSISLTIRTYDPFRNGELRPRVLKAITIGTINETNREIDLKKDLFPNKYPQRWNDITINVLPVYSPPYIMIISDIGLVGLDVLNLHAVGTRMGIKFNFSSDHILSYWGERGNDGKYSFAFGALQEHKFGISVGAFHVGFPEYADFDMAYPVMEDYLVMVVRTAPIKNRWNCLIDIFEKPVWISLLISVVLMAVVFYIRSINKREYELSVSFLICLACLLKLTISKMPKSNSQRLLLVFWLVYSFIMDAYFESHLQGALNVAHREKQINSFKEIEEIGMRVAINRRDLKLFSNDVTQIDRFVSRNHYESNSPIEVLNKSIISDCNNGVIVLERFIKYSTARFYLDSEDGSPTVHILTKKLMFCPLTVYFTKGFPPFDGIQRLLHDFKAMGYIEKLYRYDRHMVQLLSYRKGIKWKVEALNLADLKYIYWLLLGGFAFSSSILLLEMLWHKFGKLKRLNLV